MHYPPINGIDGADNMILLAPYSPKVSFIRYQRKILNGCVITRMKTIRTYIAIPALGRRKCTRVDFEVPSGGQKTVVSIL